MRFTPAAILILAAAACSSPTSTVNPPPPPPGGGTVRTLFDNLSVATSGGTFRYTKTGDALDGLTLIVPSAAYSTATQWTITADSTIVVPMPVGFFQVGPALTISNNQGYAASPIRLTVPMAIGAGNAVAPFYFDPLTKQFEGIPMVDLTTSYATLAARHFTGDFTATRGPTQAALKTGGQGFGQVVIVWAKVADSLIKGTYTTDFKPGRDDWEFANYGDFISPGGDCEGMSVSALYYQYFVKTKGASYGLYHQYDSSLPNQWDNVQGIRFAGSVQGVYDTLAKLSVDQIAAFNADAVRRGSNLKDLAISLTTDWLMLTLKMTGNPVLMGLYGAPGGHAVVAYAGTSTGAHVEISFADPNFPATERIMKFESGVLTPITLQLNAAAGASSFNKAYAVGVTADVPFDSIESKYRQFKSKTVARDREPSNYSWIHFNYATSNWDPIDNSTLYTTDSKFAAGILCTDCPLKYRNQVPADRVSALIYDELGQTEVGNGSEATLVPGPNTFVLVAEPPSPYSPTNAIGFIDSKTVTVNYATGSYAFNVLIAPLTVPIGSSLTDVVKIDRSNFTLPVTVTATSDAGITITPSETPSPGGQTTLTVSVPSSVTVGTTHTVTVTGTALGLAPVIKTFAVVAGAPSSYAFTQFQTAPVNVPAGTTSAPDVVTITRSNFTGPITLSATADSGSNILINFTAQPGTGNTGTFTVTVPAGLAAGTYGVTLTGSSTLANVNTTFAVVVPVPAGNPIAKVLLPTAPVAMTVGDAPRQLTVQLTDAGGQPTTGTVSWSADVSSVAAVDANGRVTANGAGITAVTADAGGNIFGRVLVSVAGTSGIARIEMSVSGVRFPNVADTFRYVANASNVAGNPITVAASAYTWVSSNTAVATVDQQGLVTSVGTGGAIITATRDGQVARAAASVGAVGAARGTIASTSSQYLSNAQATARQGTVQVAQVFVNPFTGLYYLPGLPAGVYQITLSVNGFPASTVTVTLSANQTTVVPVITFP